MNDNRAFLKSMRLLAQPAAMLMLALLLVNDQLLRRLWPSWWTGKLSDFAWLFLAPAVACALLAWLVPAGWRVQERVAGLLGYGFSALAFVLLKAVPGLRDAFLGLWHAFLGFPATVVLDPSDLLALPALALSAWLWFREKPIPIPIPLRGWLALPLFALLTLANMAAPDFGIGCLALEKGRVSAAGRYSTFISQNGGLFWVEFPLSGSGGKPCESPPDGGATRVNLPGAQLWGHPGSRIEISRDQGQTWQVEYRLTGANEVQQTYYEKNTGGNPLFLPGPLDGLYDPASGNVIFAMGRQGVLVRRPDASYAWAPVGSYQPLDLSNPGTFVTVLGGELVLAGGLISLFLASWSLPGKKSGWVFKLLVIGAWLAWGVNAWLLPPARTRDYTMQLSAMVLAVTLMVGLLLGAYGLFLRIERGRLRAGLTAAVGGLAFLLPYLLWYLGAIPGYAIAMIASAVIALVFAVGGSVQVALARKSTNADG